MNILHLRYAVEIEKAHSLSKAANNLYIAQPNLSRAIKELEDSLGISIFSRTPKGMFVTVDGERFLMHAKQILKTIDDVEDIYTKGKKSKETLSVSTPPSAYIAHAFAEFVKLIGDDKPIELLYKETNAMSAINNILHMDYKLGVIRYAEKYDQYYKELLDDKELFQETIASFAYILVMSNEHPLVGNKEITLDDLAPYTEIAHEDPYVPTISTLSTHKEERHALCDKRIIVYERATQFDLLGMVPHSFMWASPLPGEILLRYNLVQRDCAFNLRRYKDVLIYRSDYHPSELDKLFISEMDKAKRQFIK